MYPYLLFGIIMLGVFSIFENIKGKQKLTFFKLNILLLLFTITLNCTLEFVEGTGLIYNFVSQLFRLFGSLLTVNLFYLIASKRIPRLVIWIESVLILVYLVQFAFGFKFPIIKEGELSTGVTWFNFISILFSIFLITGSMIYNLYLINKRTDPLNLYQVKIKAWSKMLFFSVFIVIFLITIGIVAYFHPSNFVFMDSRLGYIAIRLVMILFILFRPKFIDEAGLSPLNVNFITAQQSVSLQNFDFLFYSNHYFLNPEASLDDFALKLNHPKSEVVSFLKTQTQDSFSELLNRNRTTYFKELLKSGKHESFTIEALSEMSGFNNRQSMYNALKKYEGSSPSEYINSL